MHPDKAKSQPRMLGGYGLTFHDGMHDLRRFVLSFTDETIISCVSCNSQESIMFLQNGDGLPLCQLTRREVFYMSETMTTNTKRRLPREQLDRKAAYLRKYRAEHPDAQRRWREAYILRKAARLQAEREAAEHGGN